MEEVLPYDFFPGCDFEGNEKNLAALKYLDDMFAYSRFDWDNILRINNICKSLFLLIYMPIGIVISLLRMFICFPLLCFISSICLPRSLHTILIRIQFLFLFGCWISVKGTPSNDSRIWCANHISEFDAIILRAISDPYILGYRFYVDIWWLKMSPLKLMKMVYIPTESRSEGSSARDVINNDINEVINNSNDIVLVFPEGGLTNTGIGLLQYHKFMFGLNTIVQPLVLKNKRPISMFLDTGYANFLSNVFMFFFVPFQSYEIEFLPSILTEDSNKCLQYSREIMGLTAKNLNNNVTPFLYSDKKKWLTLKHKLLKRGFDFGFNLNYQNKSVEIYNKVCNRRCNSKTSIEDETSFKDIILKNLYETWSIDKEHFHHIVFFKFENV
jgi:1-acyl-sn-glycerol-3-phosphate acyltransferase